MVCYRYIEANPVRARMVAEAEAYPWSSYAANALGQVNPLITEHRVYSGLGDTAEVRRAEYRALFAEGLSEDVITIIRDATQRGWVPGSDRFRRQIEAPVRGRPRKVEEAAPQADQLSLLQK